MTSGFFFYQFLFFARVSRLPLKAKAPIFLCQRVEVTASYINLHNRKQMIRRVSPENAELPFDIEGQMWNIVIKSTVISHAAKKNDTL